ncbi:glr3215 [Gloeobacter violaceus PCC 7421]|uniref:Signal peptidase I n=2 Tax=Gloeobacter violaceus TaxID=33072 RepID=Q7NGF4_GLOVI|nr:glr3215 [Gloeobacter violaceus PCC 7421]
MGRMQRFVLCGFALGLVGCALQTDIRLRKMPDSGMEPTIRAQEVVRENFDALEKRPPGRFDLVVVKDPDKPDETTIRRVIALPGELVQVSAYRASVGGRSLDEPFISTQPATEDGAPRPKAEFGPLTVPADEYFVLGDNRAAASDNRRWKRSSVPVKDILAVVER